MKKIALSGIMAIGLSGLLMAGGDIAPVTLSPADSWGGFYVGAQAGWIRGTDNVDVSASYAYNDRFHLKPNGGLGGLYGGYNWELPQNWLMGGEGEFNWISADDEVSTLDHDYHYKIKYKWEAAVLARLGKVLDQTYMPYILGGLTWQRIAGSWPNTENDSAWAAEDKKTLHGWTLGAGLEMKLSKNLHVRLQYRYNHYHQTDLLHDEWFLGTYYATYEKVKQHENIIQLGLSYHF